jgi:hypothetical protein
MFRMNNSVPTTFPMTTLATVLALGATSSWAHAADIVIQQRFSGHHSGMRTTGEQVIQDAEVWKQVWGQVYRTSRPQPEPPKIDFDKQTVLAVFLGNRNTGGYSIRITAVKDTGKETEVHVQRSSPRPGDITTQALTQPYDIVVIDKPDKPVRFVAQ